MHSKSHNIEIIINDKGDKLLEYFSNTFLIGIKLHWKHK